MTRIDGLGARFHSLGSANELLAPLGLRSSVEVWTKGSLNLGYSLNRMPEARTVTKQVKKKPKMKPNNTTKPELNP